MPSRPRSLSILTLAASTAWLSFAAASTQQQDLTIPATPEQIAFFEAKIRPVLAENCFSCHGPKMQMADLRLDNFAGIQKAKAIVLGKPDESPLIKAVRHTGPIKMPMDRKLKTEEIANLESWVKMGAPWPAEKKKETEPKVTLWSLAPVEKPSIPKLASNSISIKNPIDAFVLQKLQSEKLTLAPEADRRTLLRRLSYDLIGLPPNLAEVNAFIADKSPNAYEKVVDRLLSSPHYGERQARMWLDVARYADTKGYVFEEDRNYPNAYTYRDWVIQAFNRDLPYDQFVIQQLAADRLPEVQNGDDKRPLAALGFLTVGRRFLNNSHDIIDDRIDVTTRGFMGFTVSCARCHDHKFDPVPTQDYYSLYAVFASSLEKTVPISERTVREPWEQYSQRLQQAEKALRDHVTGQIKELRELNKIAEKAKTLTAETRAALQALREDQYPNQERLKQLTTSFSKEEVEKLKDLQAAIDQIQKNAPPLPEFAMAMADSGKPGDGVIFRRGNPGLRGDPAPRRFLSAVSPPGERTHWTEGSGRLQLAKAIAAKENPLTARVMVNRVWQQHFGAGLVRTSSDFGFQGDKPTHPELLDFLAASFVENGWSIKKLHRAIVTSATYRQSSSTSKTLLEKDPDNRLLARMDRKRLDLEQMRDSLLLASGRLDLDKVGGKSADIWAAPFNQRRSIYGFVERQNLPGVFKTFDFASPDTTSSKRFQTTVPQQALFFLNSPFAVEHARFTSERAEITSAQDEGQRVRRLYQLLFARLPSAAEAALAKDYLRIASSSTNDIPKGSWQYGYGEYDAVTKRVKKFVPFQHFADGGYRVGPMFPHPQLGYLTLNQTGGHPGRDSTHSVIRRWTSPMDGSVQVQGSLTHPSAQGDGVQARIIGNLLGLVGEWNAHNRTVKTDLPTLSVSKGDYLDFVVEPGGNDGFDSFSWSPTVITLDGKLTWSASSNFGPPPPAPLGAFPLYVQALLMTNEFLFVD